MKLLGNFRDIFKTVTHKKPGAIFCPRCASPDIKLSSSLDYWLTPRKYVCHKCGYSGILVMELEQEKSNQGNQNQAEIQGGNQDQNTAAN